MSRHKSTGTPALWSQTEKVVRVLRGRFSGLTVVVVTAALCADLIQSKELRQLLAAVAFTALLLFALRIVGVWLRRTILILAAPALIGHWTLRFGGPTVPLWLVFCSNTAMLVILTMVVLYEVLTDEVITADTIVGALCAYFLLGVTWGGAYAILEVVSPGALAINPALASAAGWEKPEFAMAPLLQYYSLTTLSTLGVGDVSPLSPAARILTALEGMTGQLYLAVLIARLVSIHTASRVSKRES